MNELLKDKIVEAWVVLYSMKDNHELLRYLNKNGDDTFVANLHLASEFRERFGPQTSILEWKGKTMEGYSDYLVAITFRKYLSALEEAIREKRVF